jgi:hypothetical protein
MLIGAYRDNEVDSAHPLCRKLDAIRQAGARLYEIVLTPLTCEDLGRLLVDSLHCEPERVTPLAHLVHDNISSIRLCTVDSKPGIRTIARRPAPLAEFDRSPRSLQRRLRRR